MNNEVKKMILVFLDKEIEEKDRIIDNMDTTISCRGRWIKEKLEVIEDLKKEIETYKKIKEEEKKNIQMLKEAKSELEKKL